MGAQGAETKKYIKNTRLRVARQLFLSDVITTRALYTPLVYVFSRGWSVTSTSVCFYLRVLLCRPQFYPRQGWSVGWQDRAERLLGARRRCAETELRAGAGPSQRYGVLLYTLETRDGGEGSAGKLHHALGRVEQESVPLGFGVGIHRGQ